MFGGLGVNGSGKKIYINPRTETESPKKDETLELSD